MNIFIWKYHVSLCFPYRILMTTSITTLFYVWKVEAIYETYDKCNWSSCLIARDWRRCVLFIRWTKKFPQSRNVTRSIRDMERDSFSLSLSNHQKFLTTGRSKKRETGTPWADFISEQSAIEKNVLLHRTKNYINLSLRHSFTIHAFWKKDAKADWVTIVIVTTDNHV